MTTPPQLPTATSPSTVTPRKKPKGFLPPVLVKSVAFYLISLCILAGVVVCILAIWDFAHRATLWRFASSCLVVAAGTMLFSIVNGMFGDRGES